MTHQVLICDDSSVARKQMARALPEKWDADIQFAKHGKEAVSILQEGTINILFLDLNMPELDGYGVLQQIQEQSINVITIVVSGDIQPDARKRVMDLGALEFIKKPVSAEEIEHLLSQYGLLAESQESKVTEVASTQPDPINEMECYREIANVAMGRAADLLARLLHVFVVMPIPKVNTLEVSELTMALQSSADTDTFSAVCQGFIGSGIAGEALLLFYDSSFEDMAKLTKYQGERDEKMELELIMDVASLLIGACVKGFSEQLDVNFSQGHPIVLGQHVKEGDLIKQGACYWKKTLTIEICYSIENYNINCDLLLLFTEDSLTSLRQKIAYLLE
ncbi:response regulator [Zooshikella sp. RANM57]|uniref:response regulator n=1 Tax=Zooshikella sp. RANM57 TaxID=3425863 RepID=UPI003D6E84A9